jgi:imidazolonepropionase-like amidohydrolase
MAYDLLIQGGRLVDPAHHVDAERDVAIEDGRVVEVAAEIDPASADRVIDAGGLGVIPGIIDTHVHLGGFDGSPLAVGHRMVAETGVTTVLDMGTTMSSLVAGMHAAGAGLNVAALLSSGAAFEGQTAPSRDEIGDALEAELEAGAFGLKLMGGHWPLTPDATAAAIEVTNERRAYLGYHLGTTASSSNLLGLRELPQLLGEQGRLQVAHVAAYCRGMIEEPLVEVAEALAILRALGPRIVSESYLSTKVGTGNATSGLCDGDEVADHVTRNCLAMAGYEPTRAALRRAIEEGACGVFVEREGAVLTLAGAEAREAWEDAGTQILVTFPVTPPESALALTVAREAANEADADGPGGFAITALATDGGSIPRNWMVERGLALVRAGAWTLSDYVRKVSRNPARMLGLNDRGHLGVGAAADVTLLDLERGVATRSLVRGREIMIDGAAVGSGGTLLVTEAGRTAAHRSGLDHEVIDPSNAAMYRFGGAR